MPIDASIPMMGRPVEIENPINSFAKIQQLNAYSRQNALADMQLQNMQQTMNDQRQLRQIAMDSFDPATGKLDNKKYRAGLAGIGAYQQLSELDKTELEQQEKQGKISKSALENTQLRLTLVGQTAGALRASGANRDQVLQAVSSLARDGVIPAEEAAQIMGRVPNDPASLDQWLYQAQISALDTKSQLPSYTTNDDGGNLLVRENMPGKAPTTVETLKKSPTPGDMLADKRGWEDIGLKKEKFNYDQRNDTLNRDVTIRGQNMTDSRQRENIGINRERLAFEREKENAKPGSPQSRAKDAKALSGLLDNAEVLIKESTGSYAGNVLDTAAQSVGYGTKGAKAIAKLKVLESDLILRMPKLSGPQSNLDLQLYRDAAARIADPNVPRSIRLEALKTLRDINDKYKYSNFSPDAAPDAPSGSSVEVDFGSLK